MFGKEQPKQFIRHKAALHKEIVKAVTAALDRFRGTYRFQEDMTMIAVKVAPWERSSY